MSAVWWNRKQVFVCTAQHCAQKGAQNVAGRLRIELKRKGLDVDVLVNTCDSIDLCDIGPNIVVYPDGIIYRGVQARDIPEIIESLRPGGRPVERLIVTPDSEDEVRRRRVYEEACAGGAETIPASEFLAIAQRHGFDEAWVAEQARRGFIGRRQVEGALAINVTSKARHRYGIPD